MIVRRISRTAFTAILAVALLSLPVIAIYATNLANQSGGPTDPTGPIDPTAPMELAPAAPLVDSQEQPATADHHRDDHAQGAGCRGLQMAYSRLSSNPGKGEGEGRQEALDKVVAKADERGCTLAEGEDFTRGRPSWAGGDENKKGGEGKDGEGRRGPKWATGDDGPPHGLAWGHWLKHGGTDVCDRIAERLENKPDAEIPVDLRSRIEDELGCSLP